MSIGTLWLWVEQKCELVNTLLKDKTGIDINIPEHCQQVKQNIVAILIVLAVVITILVITNVLKKLNKQTKTFEAALLQVKEITSDTKIYTFDLPNGWNNVGLKVGEHLTLSANIDGKIQDRKYTPISRADVKRNSFELLIKIYQQGKMTNYVNNLKIGEKITVTLPFGRFNYLGDSEVQIRDLNNIITKHKYDHLYLIGGGTGITPLYQIIQYVTEVETPQNKGPNITLLFANKTQHDVLCKSELEAFEKINKKLKCYFSIDKSEKQGWTGFTGFVDEEKIRATLPENRENTLYASCGPPGLVNLVEKLLTTKFNVSPKRLFRF